MISEVNLWIDDKINTIFAKFNNIIINRPLIHIYYKINLTTYHKNIFFTK